jgi:hypothetical protein
MEHYVYNLLRPSIPSWAMEWGFLAEFSLLGWCKRGLDNLLELTRCGPFSPPVMLPESDMGRMIWEVIVTDDFKQLLANSGLTGFTFRPVIKRHIIAMQWENWVLTATEPPEPIDVDLENVPAYFLSLPHSPETAEQMGQLWEVSLTEHARWKWHAGIIEWDGTDWFRVKDPRWDTDYIFVSERAKTWLQETIAEWVTFTPHRLVDADTNNEVTAPNA